MSNRLFWSRESYASDKYFSKHFPLCAKDVDGDLEIYHYFKFFNLFFSLSSISHLKYSSCWSTKCSHE